MAGCEACKVGPGKFEGEPAITALAWAAVLEGMQDETTGAGENGTLVDWFRFQPAGLDDQPAGLDDPGWVAFATQQGYCAACVQLAVAEAKSAAGLAVWETEQGFVSSRVFQTKGDYERALTEAEQEEEGEGE